MKYRKRPDVVEAKRWFKMGDHPAVWHGGLSYRPMLYTFEGHIPVDAGDWIITNEKGEHYPMKDELFFMNYEAV